MAISATIMAGVLASLMMFTKSSLRLAAYNSMELAATRGIEVFGRDLRMAQKIVSVRATSTSPIHQVVLTLPPVTGSATTDVTYTYDSTARTFSRSVGTASKVLVRDIMAGSFKFVRYDMANNSDEANADGSTPGTLMNDYSTNQLQVSMTSSPDTNGLFPRATKRVISARFVLRNR